MILVTGAAGKTGTAIIRKLTERMKPVRALDIHAGEMQGQDALGFLGEVLEGDMRNFDTLHRAVQGVEVVYHICPNVHPEELEIGQALIGACRSAGVKHFVYHSVLHPQIEAMPHHWKKMRVEEQLFESRLAYTIFQPAVYMQNMNWVNIVETGKYILPYSEESQISMVDLEDVAEAAANVLIDVSDRGEQSLHDGATYELVGTPAVTQTEVAAIWSRGLGRTVQAERMAIEDWVRKARASGLSEYAVDTLVKMFAYYEQHGLNGSPNVLSCLLNHPPTNLEGFVKRVVDLVRVSVSPKYKVI